MSAQREQSGFSFQSCPVHHAERLRQSFVLIELLIEFANPGSFWHISPAMLMSRILFALLALLLATAGCEKSTENRPSASTDSSPRLQKSTPVVSGTVARIHWLGMARITSETNAAYLTSIWNMPESAKLKAQTLDKLAAAPWRHLAGAQAETPGGQPLANLLRPLLDDLVEDESYLEVNQTTNRPGALAFAIRLDENRGDLWQTNLAKVLESLTGIHPVPEHSGHGWQLKKHDMPNFIELTRAGGWTILGAAQDHNRLLEDFVARISQDGAPTDESMTDVWLTADLDFPRAAGALAPRWGLPRHFPAFTLTVTGDGTNIDTRGRVIFSRPLLKDLPSWNVPTNLIDGSLSSFVIARGIEPWLASTKAWSDFGEGSPPDQFTYWALRSLPMQTYIAAPLSNSSNVVRKVTGLALDKGRRWLAGSDLAVFTNSFTFNGLEWNGVPFMSPFLRSITLGANSYIFAGFQPEQNVIPLSNESLGSLLAKTNLVCHQWEITGLRAEHWLYIGQFIRLVSGRAQLPFQSQSLLWLKAVAPKLGTTITDITRLSARRVSFVRRSNIGLSAVELQLLADWLESPEFPRGLHTLLAEPPAPLGR